MANSWFNPSGDPITRSPAASALIRNAFATIGQAFDMMPNPLGAGQKGFSGGTWSTPQITNPQIQAGTVGSGSSPSLLVASAALMGGGVGYSAGALPVESGTIGAFFRVAGTNRLGYARSNSGTPSMTMFFDDLRNVVMGDGANELATNATEGFFYLPTVNGLATGAATAYTGAAAMVYDRSNNKIMVRSGGTWRSTGALT